MTARNTPRTNTQTEQNKEDNSLLLYRLEMVETAVKVVDQKVTAFNSPTKQDYAELRDTILSRINEIRDGLQKQIDDGARDIQEQLKGKADKQRVDDLSTLVKAFASVFGSIITAMAIFYLTKGH
jgi:hypothetical protein